jgi:hypothetical protein
MPYFRQEKDDNGIGIAVSLMFFGTKGSAHFASVGVFASSAQTAPIIFKSSVNNKFECNLSLSLRSWVSTITMKPKSSTHPQPSNPQIPKNKRLKMSALHIKI